MIINSKKRQKFADLLDVTDKAMLSLLESVDIKDVARHNKDLLAWGEDKFKSFIAGEKNRFINALETITSRRKSGVVCDLGCFFPYLPLCCSLLGYKVKIVDWYDLYGQKFKDCILRLSEKHSIELFDLDILTSDFRSLGRNDIVLLMAVIEHLNGSPKHLMSNVPGILGPDGFLLLEVPNIAEFAKRLVVVLGHSPLPGYEGYFQSEYPFMGHNREMTVAEVRYLLEQTGFPVESLYSYDYSEMSAKRLKGKILGLLKALTPMKNKGEVIMATARLSPHRKD